MQTALIKTEIQNTQQVVENAPQITVTSINSTPSTNNNNFNTVSEQHSLQSPNQSLIFSTAEMRYFSEISTGKNSHIITSQPPINQILATIHPQNQQDQQQKQQTQLQNLHNETNNCTNLIIENKDTNSTPINNTTAQQPLHFDQAVGYLNKIKVFSI